MDLPVVGGRYERFLNAPERLSCTVTLRDPAVVALRLRYTSVPARTLLCVAYGDVILAAGIVWRKEWASNNRLLQMVAVGIWSYYDHRHILPVFAQNVSVTDFTIQNPDEPSKTIPNPALTTYISGVDLGTHVKKLVQQAHTWTGGALPVVFQPDRAGTHERVYYGPEFKNVGTVIEQITEVENGPDVAFRPGSTEDRLGVQFHLLTGTEADPLLHSERPHKWAMGVPESPVSNLQIVEDASERAGLVWATGGRLNDEVLVARAQDNRLVDEGFPLLELLDSSHSSVEKQSTLDGYAAEGVEFGYGAIDEWSFDVRANTQPPLGTYWEGDFCELDIPPYLAEANAHTYDDANQPKVEELNGDPYLYEGGTFRRRIVGMSGDDRGDTVKITTAPEVV
jgi:hypothetical protein